MFGWVRTTLHKGATHHTRHHTLHNRTTLPPQHDVIGNLPGISRNKRDRQYLLGSIEVLSFLVHCETLHDCHTMPHGCHTTHTTHTHHTHTHHTHTTHTTHRYNAAMGAALHRKTQQGSRVTQPRRSNGSRVTRSQQPPRSTGRHVTPAEDNMPRTLHQPPRYTRTPRCTSREYDATDVTPAATKTPHQPHVTRQAAQPLHLEKFAKIFFWSSMRTLNF
jgi:hypothetical protein